MKHEKAREGLWLASADQETWPFGPFFDTRDEAIAYGRVEYESWLGVVGTVVTEEMAAKCLIRYPEDADCSMCEAHDLSSEDALIEIGASEMPELLKVVANWLRETKSVRHWFQVASIERFYAEDDDA